MMLVSRHSRKHMKKTAMEVSKAGSVLRCGDGTWHSKDVDHCCFVPGLSLMLVVFDLIGKNQIREGSDNEV